MPRPIEELRARYGERYRWILLFSVMAGNAASGVSSASVAVAVPALAAHFGLGQDRVQWVSTAFMIAMMIGMLLTPWLMQRFGLRRSYLAATGLLLVGALVSGFSPWFNLIVAARLIEGFGAGVMMPIPNVVIIRTFPAQEQGRAIGVFGFCVMLAPAAGPVIGGVLVDHVGWRAVFFMVVPMALAALWFAQRFLPLGRSGDRTPPLDWLGLGAIGLAIPLLLNGLIGLKQSDQAYPWALIGAGALMLAAFVVHELRVGAPLFRLGIYARRAMAVGAAVSLVFGFAQAAVTYLLPVYLQHALGYSASRAGLIMLPTLLALGFALPIGGRLADRIASRYLVGGGMLVFGVSTLLIASPGITASFLAITLVTMFGRIGFGILLPSLSLATVRRLPAEEVAHGASMAAFMRQLGGSIGVPIAALFLESRLVTPGADVQAAYAHTFAWLALACVAGAVAGWFLEARPRSSESR